MSDRSAKENSAPVDGDEVELEFLGDAPARIAIVSLNRPDQLNPISGRPGGTRDQILSAIARAEADPAVGCIVIRGNGRAFSGGGDLTGNRRRETLEEHRDFLLTTDRFHERLRATSVPTIAEVHGFCLGAGLLLATGCDFVIAGESARFGFPEGRLGLVGISPLVTTIGRQWSKFLMLTGEIIDAHRARDIGLVLTVESDDSLHTRVLDLAGRISRMPRSGVVLNRRTIDAVADAAGDADGRRAAVFHDSFTLQAGDLATAPDGRTFRSILDSEGMDGMKKARAQQYRDNWLT